MNKVEELLIEETIKVFEKTACKETYQMAEGIKEAVKYYHQSKVNAISEENKNIQDAFDKVYDNCLRLLKKYEPETLEKRIKEIENV